MATADLRYPSADDFLSELESFAEEVSGGEYYDLLTPYDEGVFYAASSIDGIMTASLVQVYLDVISSRARGQEAAEAIRRKLEAAW